MPKFYLLLTSIIFCTAAFGQHVVHKEIVVHPSGEMGAGNAPRLLNESGMIQVKKGDTYSIRPGFVPGSGRSNVLKGVAKAVVAGVATYELAKAAMPSNAANGKGSSVAGKAVKSLLPAVGAGLTLSYRDLTGKSSRSRPYLQYLFYDQQSKLTSVKTVPLDKKTQTLEGRVEKSGFMKVMLEDQPGSKLRSDDMVINMGRSVVDANVAIGYENFGDEGDDGGGGDDGSAAAALFEYIQENGIGGLEEGSFDFNDDGSVTYTDPYGNSETMTQDEFLDQLADAELDDYDALLDDYDGEDNGDPVTACIDGMCFSITNDQVLIDVPPQSGNTCLVADMSWMMSMLGLDNVPAITFMAYYNANYDPDDNIPVQGWGGTPDDFQNFMNDFFSTNPDYSFGIQGLEGAVDNGNFVIVGADFGGITGHMIVIDGYTTEGGDPDDPIFSYHDPATGSTGTISYGDLEDAEREGFSAEITGINTEHPPGW